MEMGLMLRYSISVEGISEINFLISFKHTSSGLVVMPFLATVSLIINPKIDFIRFHLNPVFPPTKCECENENHCLFDAIRINFILTK